MTTGQLRFSDVVARAGACGLEIWKERSHWRPVPGMRMLPADWLRRLMQFGYEHSRLARIGSERLVCFRRRPG